MIRFVFLATGLAGIVAVSFALASAGEQPVPGYHAFLADISRGEEPTPTPEPPPYEGPVASLSLESAHLTGSDPIEQRGTKFEGGREYLEDPTGPDRIAWYPAFGHPGSRAGNSLFAAHVDYMNYGRAPFWYLTTARVGDLLRVTMANGNVYIYSVQSVEVIPLQVLDMQQVVYPGLASDRERVTLISCGGTFVPYAGGGGEYESRVVLVAERIIP